MCDNDSMDDMVEYELRSKELSRRAFGALAVGTSLTAMLPIAANAAEVKEQEVEIKTPDGVCDAYFVHPAKPSAAVLVWPDILGLRPAFRQMGKRLAEQGYVVLTVDTLGSRGHLRCTTMPDRFEGPARDAYAALDYLAAQPFVDARRFAAVSFSLGAISINELILMRAPRPAGATLERGVQHAARAVRQGAAALRRELSHGIADVAR